MVRFWRSTFADVLGRKGLPRPELLTSFVHTCGRGSETTAWLDVLDVIARREAPEHGLDEADAAPTDGRSRDNRHGRVRTTERQEIHGASPTTDNGRRVRSCYRTDGLDADPGRPAIRGRPARGVHHFGRPVNTAACWMRLRPVTAPHLCLTDGRIQNHRLRPAGGGAAPA